VGGPEYEKGIVRFILDFFNRVFELPSPRNAQKRDLKNREKNRFWIFGRMFCKSFSTRCFLQNVVLCVFEFLSLQITRKRDKTKEVEQKLASKFLSIFLGKSFRHRLFVKIFLWCF
jgi:hypothetical protein